MFHLIPIRMAPTEKTENKCWWGCADIGTLCPAGGNVEWQPLWKTVQRFLKKLKIEPPGDIAIPLWGIFPKEPKAEFQRDICMSLFIAALFTTAKTWKEPKWLLTDEWISKMWYIHTYSGLFFSLKKDGNSAICYNVDESWGHYAKCNKPVTKTQKRCDSIYMRYWE